MSSCMKYFMASYRPKSRCFFCSIPARSVFDSARLRLFPSFILLVLEITSGCILHECAFSLACAGAMVFCTVRKHSHFCFPSWCNRSTQSSILSPNPPRIFVICHSTCFSIRWTLSVMVHRRSLLPFTTALTYIL